VRQKSNRAIARVLGDRQFFLTIKGCIGIGCNAVSAGDFVCVLLGGDQPSVFRREQTYAREEGGEPYTLFSLFGAAYVHGIVDGEAMHNVSESNTFDFVLR